MLMARTEGLLDARIRRGKKREVAREGGGVKKLPARLNRSPLEVLLAWQMDAAKLVYISEYRFHATRKWRVDFAFAPRKLAVEVEGGGWVNGRHNRGAGMQSDCEKYNALTLAGWRLLRFTGAMIKSGEALRTIERALNERRTRTLAPTD